MRIRPPAYLILLVAACAGTEVGNPTFACSSDDSASRNEGMGGAGGSGGTGGSGGLEGPPCNPNGSDCGLSATVGSFADAACPGGASRNGLLLTNLTDAPIAGWVLTSNATVTVVPNLFEIPPHDAALLAVVFEPPADAGAGRRGAVLEITLDEYPPRTMELDVEFDIDPRATSAMSLLCEGDAPCELLDFGAAPVGGSTVVPLIVVNDGCEPIELLAPELGPEGRVTLVDPPAFPAAIPPRGELVLELSFTPAASGPTSGTLQFTAGGTVRPLPWQGIGQ